MNPKPDLCHRFLDFTMNRNGQQLQDMICSNSKLPEHSGTVVGMLNSNYTHFIHSFEHGLDRAQYFKSKFDWLATLKSDSTIKGFESFKGRKLNSWNGDNSYITCNGNFIETKCGNLTLSVHTKF